MSVKAPAGELELPAPAMPEDARSLASQAAAELATVGRSFVVTTPEQYVYAAERLRETKSRIAKLDEIRFGITRKMDAAKAAVMDLFRQPREQLVALEHAYKDGLIAFDNEQARIRAEQQRIADEAARKERERLAAQQEAAAKKARDDAARLQAEADAAAAAGRAEEAAKLQQRAAKAEDRGAAKVEQLAQQEAAVVAPIISSESTHVAGISRRGKWKYRVVNPTLIPRQFLMIDEAKLARHVANMKDDHGVAGIVAYFEPTIGAARS